MGGSDDRAHDRERRAGGFQPRTLLDVQLDERIDIVLCSARQSGRVQAALAPRGPDFGVDRVDRARDRARAPEIRAEARALFLADCDHFERAPGLAPGFEQRLDGSQTGDDAECAVEPAAPPHRVDVRTGDDGFALLGALRPAPDIADGVVPRFEAGVFHPALDAFARGGPRAAVERPIGAAIWFCPDGVELI